MWRAETTNFSRNSSLLPKLELAQRFHRLVIFGAVPPASGTSACRSRRRPPCSSASPGSRSAPPPPRLRAAPPAIPYPAAAARRTPRAIARAVCFKPNTRICSGVGPMNTTPLSAQTSRKIGVFAQESVARMNRLRARLPRRFENRPHRQIALRRRRRPDQHRLIRLLHVQANGGRLPNKRPPNRYPYSAGSVIMRHAIAPRLAIRTLRNISDPVPPRSTPQSAWGCRRCMDC